MFARLRGKIGEWYILGIGLCAVAGGLFIISASTPSAAPPPVERHQESQGGQPARTVVASPPPASAKPAASPQSSTAIASAAQADASMPVQPAADVTKATQAPEPATHEHNMQNMAASAPSSSATTGQAPPSASSGTAVADGDAAAGRLVFRKCQACHSMEPGKNLLGPSLAGLIGRKAGTEANYNYSPAMKQANIVWDAKTLDAYLADPQKVVPGNKMPFPGLKTEQDRADIIAFFAGGGGAQAAATAPGNAPAPGPAAPAAASQAAPQSQANQAAQAATSAGVTYVPDANYTLRCGIAEGRMVYIGVGGAIDGKVNPILTASEGGRPAHAHQWRGRRARHRVSRSECQVAARHRQGRQHHDCLPGEQSR